MTIGWILIAMGGLGAVCLFHRMMCGFVTLMYNSKKERR